MFHVVRYFSAGPIYGRPREFVGSGVKAKMPEKRCLINEKQAGL